MKGEVGELKVLFDFSPQSRYYASLHTHSSTHALCCTWHRAHYVSSVSEVTVRNSNKATGDPAGSPQIDFF